MVSPRLSVFMIVKNEAADLPACLDSVKGLADELIVVDDESTDATIAIARERGAKVLTRKLEGFAQQKQFALDQATGEWAFLIDADERVTPALAEEIKAILSGPSPADGYEIRRNMFFLKRPLSHGGMARDWVLRLFKRSKGRFRQVRVHEGIEVDGRVSRLSAVLDHFSYASLEEYVQKSNHYTSLAAHDLYGRGIRTKWTDALRPSWELFSRIVLRGAWLDGTPGLLYAALSAQTARLRSAKLWELEQQKSK